MRNLFIALAVMLPGVASAQQYSGATTDYSQAVGTTAVQVLPLVTVARQWERVINASASSSGTLWCSRSLGASVAANAAGAFPLGPYGNASGQPSSEELSTPTHYVPNTALWCIASSGSVSVTAEVAPK